MTTNARIRTIGDDITAEVISEWTHLYYDPTTGSGSVSFQNRERVFVGSVCQPLAGNYDALELQIADIATRCLATGADPVTGADLSQISAAGLAVYFKSAFDTLYNERAAEAAAAAAPAEQPTT